MGPVGVGGWVGYLRPDQFLDHLTVIKTGFFGRVKKSRYQSRKFLFKKVSVSVSQKKSWNQWKLWSRHSVLGSPIFSCLSIQTIKIRKVVFDPFTLV